MSKTSRREFLRLSGGLLGAAAIGSIPPGCRVSFRRCGCRAAARWDGFRYAMCNESMRELAWEEQCAIIAGAGYTGVEIAAFTLVQQGVEELGAAQRREMAATMEDCTRAEKCRKNKVRSGRYQVTLGPLSQ